MSNRFDAPMVDAPPLVGTPPCVCYDNLRRCRVSLTTREIDDDAKKGYELETNVVTGWAVLDKSGQWLHFYDDDNACWQSFSRESVNWIDWERVE